MRKKEKLLDRFLNKCSPEPNSGCWLWLGSVRPPGYGQIWDGEQTMESAHRTAHKLFVGKIPTGSSVLHKCDVMSCVNPDHLFLGTAQDNRTDMQNKKRGTRSKNGLPYGVSRHRKKFKVQLRRNGTKRYYGTFNTMAEAASVAESVR